MDDQEFYKYGKPDVLYNPMDVRGKVKVEVDLTWPVFLALLLIFSGLMVLSYRQGQINDTLEGTNRILIQQGIEGAERDARADTTGQ